ncbi:MAG: hypothetical protein AB7H48_12650 [Parachlamydiales bacterium]
MATVINPNPAATATATVTHGATDAANTATPTGVAATQDTIQSAQTPATDAAESKGFCAQIGSFFKGIADGIASFFSSIFSKIKSLFVKAEETPAQTPANTPAQTPANTATTGADTTTATPPAATPLEALRTAIASNLGRDEVVVAFALLAADVQDAVKGTMWNLAGADIVDENNLQPNERQNADDWAGRVIRNELQAAGEGAPRADIQRYAGITDANSLFRRAIDAVITQQAAATATV